MSLMESTSELVMGDEIREFEPNMEQEEHEQEREEGQRKRKRRRTVKRMSKTRRS